MKIWFLGGNITVSGGLWAWAPREEKDPPNHIQFRGCKKRKRLSHLCKNSEPWSRLGNVVSGACWAAEMAVLYQSPCGRHQQGLEQLHSQAPPTPTSPTTRGFGVNVQGTAFVLAWVFHFYKSDLSPRLTLMLIPSLTYGADDDVRDKCWKTEPGSF